MVLVACAVALLLIVFMCYAHNTIKNDLTTHRKPAVDANKLGCVTDADWSKVLAAFVKGTDMSAYQ